ncbi:AAA family ATPase [Methanoregula sp.]|uniref:ATP-binding protein n=1 Tax=Methanoregula sp. TaxID=2052170 RepID=UPI002375ED74|nr:AAA family ATPase [Methanoregula sp.]MDD1685987.1 AAA family ATPase [Methanoregula sp.]
MKIAVCGKGGVGKTFIVGTLAAHFAASGRQVIAIDADSSPNLALNLGLSLEEASRILPVADNEDLIRIKTGTEHPGVFRLLFTVDDIISRYAVPTPSGANLLVMGTVKSMGSGCVCPAHSVIKALIRHLVVERNEIVILDMEAGIEHLGRGTAEHVDVLLAVADANLKSLEIASTICRLAQESEIRTIGLVANRVANSRQESLIRTYAGTHGLLLIGRIPFDERVADAGMSGELPDPSGSLAMKAIGDLADCLETMMQDTPRLSSGGVRI